MNNDITAIEAYLDNSPANWDVRKIYADLLIDSGREDLARVQFLLIKYERYPQIAHPNTWNIFVNNIVEYRWYSTGFYPNGFYTLPPGCIFNLLLEHKENPKDYWRYIPYLTRKEAEEALVKIL